MGTLKTSSCHAVAAQHFVKCVGTFNFLAHLNRPLPLSTPLHISLCTLRLTHPAPSVHPLAVL